MKTKVYIDGQAGTTGLQIFDRIGSRDDLELLRIAEEKRHDNNEPRRRSNGDKERHDGGASQKKINHGFTFFKFFEIIFVWNLLRILSYSESVMHP